MNSAARHAWPGIAARGVGALVVASVIIAGAAHVLADTPPDKSAPKPVESKPAKSDAPAKPSDDTVIERKARLNDIIDKVTIKDAAAKDAFEWWSNTTGIKLLINWTAMEKDGVDPSQRVNLDLTDLPAGQALALIMRQASPEQDLVYEGTPWYVEVMTKKQANARPVLKTYSLGDLVHVPPPVNVVTSGGGLSSSSRVGSGASSRTSTSSSGFVTSSDSGPVNEREAGEELARIITETIEPEIWTNNGGNVATARYTRGMLIVKAPLYVHAQIALPKGDREYRVVKAEPATESRAVKSGSATSDAKPAEKPVEKSPQKSPEKLVTEGKPATK